jgi:hypothetical protein
MKKGSSVNYGIQANSVQANAIAVGPHAQATVPAAERDAAVGRLAEAIQALSLAAEQQQHILDQLGKLSAGAPPQRASIFDKIVSALKSAGKAVEVIAPLKAVAAAFGLPLPF